jgi:hypothetical protein
MESYARWQPVPDVTTPCAEIVLYADPGATTVRLRFSLVRDAAPRDLVLGFGRDVVACTSYEEFAHPWQLATGDGAVPRLAEPWAGYAFPLLLVQPSRWLASFSDYQLDDERRSAAAHYRLVSLDNTVDVLTTGRVTAEWVAAAS